MATGWTTAHIPLLRHKYRYYGTCTVTTAQIPLLRHIYRYYGTYIPTTAHIPLLRHISPLLYLKYRYLHRICTTSPSEHKILRFAATVLYCKTHETIPEIPKNGAAVTTAHLPLLSPKYRYLQYICTIPKRVALQRRANVKSWPHYFSNDLSCHLCLFQNGSHVSTPS